jgi:hypothetical protein
MNSRDVISLKEHLSELGNRSQQLDTALNILASGDELDLSEQISLAEKVLSLDDCISRVRMLLAVGAMSMSHIDNAPFKASSDGETLSDKLTQQRRDWDEALKQFGRKLMDDDQA